MKDTGLSRKVDSGGRIIIPSSLRDELKIGPGDLYEFYVLKQNNKTYLCIECYNLEDEIERAKRILQEAGIKVV